MKNILLPNERELFGVMFFYLTIVLVSSMLAFKKQIHIPLVIISKTMWLKLREATPVKMTLEMFVVPFLPEVSSSIAESADQIIV